MTTRFKSFSARSVSARSIAALLAATVFVQVGRPDIAYAAPTGTVSSPAPSLSRGAPKAADVADGDSSVSGRSGNMSYSYPIAVPPGRNGMAPKLSLDYSSSAPIYGGIAAGWSLSIPHILEDTSKGRLPQTDPPIPGVEQVTFISTLAGHQRLVPVTEDNDTAAVYQTYRAQYDDSFMRYERMRLIPDSGYRWRVRATSGTVMYFGEASRFDSRMTGACLPLRNDGFAPLTSVVDAYGNETVYYWGDGAHPDECVIQKITWGQNLNSTVGISQPFAQVVFTWRPSNVCNGVPVGSHTSYRTGVKTVTGASQLASIIATAFPPGSPTTPEHTRTITLGYDAQKSQCNNFTHSPVRLLTSIQESAFGNGMPQVDLPPVTFEYGNPSVNLSVRTGSGILPLAWGKRFRETVDDRWPTVEQMLLDVDGDGRLDQVYNTSTATTDGACTATWYKSLGGPARQIPLPRLKWNGNGVPGTNASGSQTASTNGYRETCALNGQTTVYRNSNNGGFCHKPAPTGSTCSYGPDPQNTNMYCATDLEGTECPLQTPAPPLSGNVRDFTTYLVYRWLDADGDGLVDLVAAVNGNIKYYDIVQGNLTNFPAEPNIFGPWPACPNDMQPGPGDWPLQGHSAYQRCWGLYPWFIYRGLGDGKFAGLTQPGYPLIKYSPIPLDPDTGDSQVGPAASNVSDTYRTLMDFDGDDILDAIQITRNTGIWHVWLGDGTGGFRGRRYTFPARSAIAGTVKDPDNVIRADYGLFDIHSDGLPEHWVRVDPNNFRYANLAINDSLSFRLPGGTGEINTPTDVRPATDRTFWLTQATPFQIGFSKATNRTIDVDHDGRIDVVALSHSGPDQDQTGALVYYNVGGQFQPFNGFYLGDARGIGNQNEGKTDETWQLNTDVADINGDGILESVSATQITYADLSSGPPRLMTSIDNGRGAKSFVTYASMHDTSAVEQHPEQTWFDGRPKSSPRTQWVVKQIRVHDNFPSQDSTTSYYYKNPRYGADDRNHSAFRGFEEVTITGPSGAKTIETYGYDVDWSGRLVKSIVQAADGQIHSIAKTRYEKRTMLFGVVTTVHAVESEALVCANGQTESTCTAATAPGYTRNLTELTLHSSTTSPGNGLLWAATQTTVQSNTAASNGDRRTTQTFWLHADPYNYILRPRDTLREALSGGTWTLVGRTRQTWDSTYRYKQTDELWVNTNDADRSITSYLYQPDGSGNLLATIKPKQAGTGKQTTYTYDARKLFVAREVNELGHQSDFVHEYGTGANIQTDGPNSRTCTVTCPQALPTYPVRDRSQIKVDGLGRTIEVWNSFSNDGSIYTLRQTNTTTYVDTPPPSTPAYITNRTRLDDSATPVWREETTELDGHGRPIRSTVLAQGDATANHVTTWTYRADGTLQSVSTPDPTTNDASLVTYSYTYDSLGRPKTIRRPDNTTPTSQSGMNIAYDGVTETSTAIVGAAGGPAAVTKVFRDRFSRVSRVDELRTSPSTWATTTYTYAADGTVATIVGPQGVTTSLKHDFAGNRTEVTRHGRTWKYKYDKNGNLESEIAPGGTATTEALYTTSIVYDDLDRPKSKAVALRGMSAADQALFGVGTETFTWDTGSNGIGNLASWSTKGSTAAATVSTSLNYDANAYAWGTTHAIQVAGYPAITRSAYAYLNIFGAPQQTRFLDKVGAGTNETSVDYFYDARGLPKSLRLNRTGEASIMLAEQTRNVAGFVTKRRNNTASPNFVEANFIYDKLGRITRQDVLRSQTPTRVVRQDLTYFGTDDPRSLTHYLGATSRVFNFGYDVRGQITSVASTTAGYFNATYAYGAGGRFSRATEAQTISPLPAGTEVRARDVNYVYGDADPERVTALTNVSSGTTHAAYAYDAAGNITRRCYGGAATGTCAGESMDYVYDGKDQLRRATRKLNGVVQGSEEYWYGASGERVAIVKRNASGTKTELIVFIGGVQAHYDGAGTNTKVYSHVALGTPVARVQRTSAATSLEYQFHGLADNTIAAVAYNGTINASFSYAPFGELLETTNGGGSAAGVAAHKRRFNDEYQDDVSGLGYYGARYYDKTLMGWTQADPLYLRLPEMAGKPRRGNVYQFSLNNPLSYIDPDGLRDQKLSPPSFEVGLGYQPVENDFGGFGLPDWATNAYWNPFSIFHWSKSDPINRSVECSQPGPCGDPVGQYVSEWLSTITEKQVKVTAAVSIKGPQFQGASEWTICNPFSSGCEVDWEGIGDIAIKGRDPVGVFFEVFLDTSGGQAPDADHWPAQYGGDPWATDNSSSIVTSSMPPPSPQPPVLINNIPSPGKGKGKVPRSQRDKQRGASEGQRDYIIKTQKVCAGGCGTKLTRQNMVVHHIVRWADGGMTVLSNLLGLCRTCHNKVHHRGIPLNQLRRRNGLPPLRERIDRAPTRRSMRLTPVHHTDESRARRAAEYPVYRRNL